MDALWYFEKGSIPRFPRRLLLIVLSSLQIHTHTLIIQVALFLPFGGPGTAKIKEQHDIDSCVPTIVRGGNTCIIILQLSALLFRGIKVQSQTLPVWPGVPRTDVGKNYKARTSGLTPWRSNLIQHLGSFHHPHLGALTPLPQRTRIWILNYTVQASGAGNLTLPCIL